jgi:uncharacterized YccA/Bax inhibitor family protein
MASSNPAFTNSPAFNSQRAIPAAVSAEQLDELYGRPSATPVETDRMTYEDTIVKTVVSFAILLAGAVVGWIVPVLALPAALIGFVLALVNIFKKKPSKALVLSYAAFEGVFLGVISNIVDNRIADGAAMQAVIGTMAVFAGVLIAYKAGWIRVNRRFYGFVMAAALGFVLLMAVNLLFTVFGGGDGLGFRSGALGIVFGVIGIILGACFLALDFKQVEDGIAYGAPREESWLAAFGLTLTLVWIYMEFLRIIAILNSND